MNDDLARSDLDTVVAEARLVGEVADRTFGPLSSPQINWKPAPTEWSIGQCFEHVIRTNAPYLPMLEAAIEGRRRRSMMERVPLLPRLFGRMLVQALRPSSGRRLEAHPAFQPSEQPVDTGITARFLAQQAELLRLVEATSRLDLERIIVTSPVAPVVTYSLMDAYRIIVVHEQNHLMQAQRVLDTAGFPAA